MQNSWHMQFIDGGRAGEQLSIAPLTYRVFVRADDTSVTTMQLTRQGDRVMDPQSDALLQQHLQRCQNQNRSDAHRLQDHRRDRDIALPDASISRTHALLFHNGQSLSLADLMSTNGSFVNGQPINDLDLCDGDKVRLGQTTLRVIGPATEA